MTKTPSGISRKFNCKNVWFSPHAKYECLIFTNTHLGQWVSELSLPFVTSQSRCFSSQSNQVTALWSKTRIIVRKYFWGKVLRNKRMWSLLCNTLCSLKLILRQKDASNQYYVTLACSHSFTEVTILKKIWFLTMKCHWEVLQKPLCSLFSLEDSKWMSWVLKKLPGGLRPADQWTL